MLSKNTPDQLRQPLSDVYALIARQVRPPFSLVNFLAVAAEIIAQTYALHKENHAFPLFINKINVSYDPAKNHYYKIKAHHHSEATALKNIANDIYQITPVLEKLLAVTDIAPHGAMGQIIAYIVENELQAFRLACDHFQDKNMTESLEMLSKVFAATKTSIAAPASIALKNLDITLVTSSGIIPKVLGKFIQSLANDENFNEKLIGFLIQRTTTYDSMSQSILRGPQLNKKANRLVDLNQVANALPEITSPIVNKEALTQTETLSTAGTTPVPVTPPPMTTTTNTEENSIIIAPVELPPLLTSISIKPSTPRAQQDNAGFLPNINTPRGGTPAHTTSPRYLLSLNQNATLFPAPRQTTPRTDVNILTQPMPSRQAIRKTFALTLNK